MTCTKNSSMYLRVIEGIGTKEVNDAVYCVAIFTGTGVYGYYAKLNFGG